RLVYGTGIACIGSALLAAGSLDRLWQFYLFIGEAVGLGVAMTGMGPASAMLSRLYPARLSRAIGIAFSAMGLGIVCFVPLAQALVENYGWRSAYRRLGGFPVGLSPVVPFRSPATRVSPRR